MEKIYGGVRQVLPYGSGMLATKEAKGEDVNMVKKEQGLTSVQKLYKSTGGGNISQFEYFKTFQAILNERALSCPNWMLEGLVAAMKFIPQKRVSVDYSRYDDDKTGDGERERCKGAKGEVVG